ncbi:MAG: sensor histidine kinase, partial [Sphingomonadales bacterium]
MFFDDRLATVLRHRATSERGARTQFRQLLDLLGNRKYGRDESLIAAAWLRLGALSEQIPAAERARMIREPGWRFRNPQLAEHLAEDEPEVVSAALSRANLSDDDWVTLIPRLPIRARGFLRLRRDLSPMAEDLLERLGIHDRGLPQPEAEVIFTEEASISDETEVLEMTVEAPPAPEEPEQEKPPFKERRAQPEPANEKPRQQRGTPRPTSTAEEKTEIAALVERIAQFRRGHVAEPVASDLSPRLPLDERALAPTYEVTGFGFSADVNGRIDWADQEVSPMVVGQRLFNRQSSDRSGEIDPLVEAFTGQQPIEGLARSLDGASAIRGEWIVDAHPQFSRSGGRFHGYVGRFRRPFDPGKLDAGRLSEADRMRQLLHELRTPVNAIQGFAELIHQQLYGPVPNAYRALAAAVAGDAASILSGFDELERLAKLESGAISVAGGKTDILELFHRMSSQLAQVLAPRMAGIDLAQGAQRSVWAEIDHDEAEALAWRLLATLAGTVTAGEVLAADIETDQDEARFLCQIPAQLIAEDDIFAADIKAQGNGLSAGLFGAGFSLRLARAEARGAGGDLVQEEDRVCLSLPLTAVAMGNPEDAADRTADPSEDAEAVLISPSTEAGERDESQQSAAHSK